MSKITAEQKEKNARAIEEFFKTNLTVYCTIKISSAIKNYRITKFSEEISYSTEGGYYTII